MRDPIEKYLEDVLCYADLAREDERAVSAELNEHLHSLIECAPLPNPRENYTPKEIYAMLKDQFGLPKKVGREIAIAKGRVRTYFKKQWRKLPWQVGIALVLGIAVRFAVAQPFYVAGDGVAPMIPRGSSVLVYKLAQNFAPGDVIVYRNSLNENLLGKVVRQTGAGLIVQRYNGADCITLDVARSQIVGRVFLNTR
jgi:signal peptidase I